MTSISLTPKEFNDIYDSVLINFMANIHKHLRCICNKKMHKNCPRCNFDQMSKMVYDNRSPIGDKILHLQSKKIIMPVGGGGNTNTNTTL